MTKMGRAMAMHVEDEGRQARRGTTSGEQSSALNVAIDSGEQNKTGRGICDGLLHDATHDNTDCQRAK